ncbi:class I SAM-dependent methyltransferase [Myxacorys almedinensis]|uniref:Methyltransferase domain-containing protein n=1 Tax=Myxacorys almedinensis A TaxID=2690445 RepID=A0A8J7YZY7_9CYAN|nr:class I SAM-dependent methyltransferase [Myxacorys almedinensis]NDJ16495.1 methyltransferase domain-containing protein [Myxacorys almedinensis A]
MTAAPISKPRLVTQAVNGLLAIKPLFNLAKYRARQMMIRRAESIGVAWREEAAALRDRNWSAEFDQVHNPDLAYPEYYLRPFHAYTEGNMGWQPATEVEVAAHAVHARIWKNGGIEGDSRLRQSYHEALKAQLSEAPNDIVDLGCSVGMSTFALQRTFPNAKVTGVDLSPYFLAVAHYRTQRRTETEFSDPTWVHAAAESTGLPSAAFDLVSASLVFHELPRQAAIAILQEAKRLLRPGGHLAIMDMNPTSEIYAKMPPYILTLLKSTEPYLDEYFVLDLEAAIVEAGFAQPALTCNTPRHRAIVAQAK